ncbi:MAG: PLD nuclease N-terminal domain-containing protein [Micrococcales bacterium]
MRVFGLAVLIVFTVFVTVFAGSANKNEVRGLPRWVWVLLCLTVTPLGGILYLIFGRPLPGTSGSGQGIRRNPVAPDDDAEFLRRLEDEIRRDRDDKND